MPNVLSSLAPQPLWNHFAALNAVPRASKKEERVIAFIQQFGENLGLSTEVDHIGNVLIKKPASPGMEDRQTVVLQSHLDMVHQKNTATKFDFDTEGIRMLIDGDWVKADGTTLGADNGIGVATIMALLSSNDIVHPPLEALFTIDEETGMTGALELQPGWLSGSILLNLDTEDDHELTIGCAGGVDITGKGSYTETSPAQPTQAFEITITGLTGGHSGMDINLGRGNANKLMNRLLYQLTARWDVQIASIDGGSLRNAIPRESVAIVHIEEEHVSDVLAEIAIVEAQLKKEYHITDPHLNIEARKTEHTGKVLNADFQSKILKAIYATDNGVYRMSPDIPGLVQTSNNVARVAIIKGEVKILCLCRSSVDTEKADMAIGIGAALELAELEVTMSGAYPGWTPNPNATIVTIMADLYTELFDGNADVNACHAGLECGIIGKHYPDMEMISFGPNIRGAHSPDEKVQISSVQKYWTYLLETLKRIPKR